jgi:membrane-associated phospholipid phosphatase
MEPTAEAAKACGPRLFSARFLRVSELVLLAYFGLVPLRALAAPLPPRECCLLAALNLLVLGALYGTAVLATHPKARLASHRAERWQFVRNTLPAALVLLAYRESGFFYFPDPAHRLDHLFERWDLLLLNHRLMASLRLLLSPWWQYYLEACYLLCYPLVLLGLVTFLVPQRGAAGHTVRASIDHFWTTVLLALLTCYTLYPWFPLTPPRLLFHDVPAEPSPLLRRLNVWLLDQYGVQACLFPSGHVAAAVATALAVTRRNARWGILFLGLAASIAVATVFLRYHYGADAIAGACVAALAFGIAKRIHHLGSSTCCGP